MQRLNYGQFDGTIQALKVDEKYMLLTFCLDRLFSIVLTREPKILAIDVRHAYRFYLLNSRFEKNCIDLIFQDLQNIRILLKNRGLLVLAGRGECSTSNSIEKMSILALLGITTIAFLLKHL